MHIRDRLLARIAGMKLWPPEYQEAIGFLHEDAKTFARMYDKLVDVGARCEEKVQTLEARLAEVERERDASREDRERWIAKWGEQEQRLASLTEAARPFAQFGWLPSEGNLKSNTISPGDVRRLRAALERGEGRFCQMCANFAEHGLVPCPEHSP